MANPVTITTRPLFEQSNTNVHGAWDLRQSLATSPGAGVAGYEDFRVMQTQAGAAMTVDVGKTSVGLMEAWVRGSTITSQGLYKVTNIDWTAPTVSTYNAQMTVTVAANTSGNPRLDIVILEIADNQHAGSSFLAQIRVVTGTPTAGATLDTRNGAAAIPASSTLLADLEVIDGATTIPTAKIRDRRAFPLPGTVPPLLTKQNMVAFRPTNASPVNATYGVNHATNDLFQQAALMELPIRIVGANRINWSYTQQATAITGNYALTIYDASGRLIVGTGAVAYAGAANSEQRRAEVIAATDFEPGKYYVHFGNDSAAAGSALYVGVDIRQVLGIIQGPAYVNSVLFSATGGTTAPSTILSMTDMGGVTTTADIPSVPLIALSVV